MENSIHLHKNLSSSAQTQAGPCTPETPALFLTMCRQWCKRSDPQLWGDKNLPKGAYLQPGFSREQDWAKVVKAFTQTEMWIRQAAFLRALSNTPPCHLYEGHLGSKGSLCSLLHRLRLHVAAQVPELIRGRVNSTLSSCYLVWMRNLG